MFKKLFLLVLLIPLILYPQKNENDWVPFSNELIETISISKQDIFEIKDFKFEIIWDSKLSFSENIGYYGGIRKLIIYKENNKIQEINNIEDNIALGTINLSLYDYNFDGYLDFTIPINSRWLMYFIFNPQINQFEHREDWDYLKIQQIDKKNKMILSEPTGNALESYQKKYKIEGLKIIQVN